MSKGKANFVFNFHAPVGQNIANVERMDVHMDKDGQIQVMNSEQMQMHCNAARAENTIEDPKTAVSKFFRTDKQPLDTCKNQFNEIIVTSKNKQDALRQIRHVSNTIYFNPTAFTHQELADELNHLQTKHCFTKEDVDTAWKSK